MKKVQCKEGLDIYKKFLTRMTRISEFLKVAEVSQEPRSASRGLQRLLIIQTGWLFLSHPSLMISVLFLQQVGIDRGDIPDLSQVSRDGKSKDNKHLASLQLL